MIAMAALAGAGILAVFYWAWFCHAGESWAKSGVKTGSVLLLALAAWAAGGPGLLLVALLFCALGDYLLSRDSEAYFLAGVGAFAAGHMAYVGLFLRHAGADARPVWIVTVLSAGFIVLGLFMATLLWRRAGTMRLPVLFYIPVILAMGWAALGVPVVGALALVLPGALLFIASDFILALEVFVLSPEHRLRRAAPFAVWPTYWGAQALFTLAFTAS
ncbi:lysoplasmalogenase [Aquicoccus sp. G2-2]|uniref:lysoplasmalogenase n=1 Tax=Aquicoccus sp. G2-2 TaxID=3092120 RepID=UPI002ADF28E5|nr:lysoplasmalogenase [Aquicoccus sp. G2-2]MEA1114143.1 lysoplasmalogenase [Aquicoccus sp. G2-2]